MSLQDTLDNIRSSPVPPNEQEVITEILVVVQGLGWDPLNDVKQEYPVPGGRIDIALCGPERVVAFIEAKAPRVNLSGHVEQVVKYAFREGVDICVLTNGLEWWLYLPMKRVPFEERRFETLLIRTDHVEELEADLVSFLGSENLLSGRAHELAERRWELNVTIPEVWDDIVTGLDDGLLDLVSTRVNDRAGLRPTREEVRRVLERLTAPSAPRPCEPPPPSPPRPPGPDCPSRPTGIMLWGEYSPVKSGNEILMRVAERLYEEHPTDFVERILTSPWASRRPRARWKEVGSTGIFLNVNIKVDELIRRARVLLEHFGHKASDLQIVHDRN